MSDISTEIARIEKAKGDLKTAIEAKGVTVGGGTIDTYPALVESISTERGNVIEEAGAAVNNIIVNLYILPYMGHSGGNAQSLDDPQFAVVTNSISTHAVELGSNLTRIDIGLSTNGEIVCENAVSPVLKRSSYDSDTKTRTVDLFFNILEYMGDVTIILDWVAINESMKFFVSDGHPYIQGECDFENHEVCIYVSSNSHQSITQPTAYNFSLMSFLE